MLRESFSLESKLMPNNKVSVFFLSEKVYNFGRIFLNWIEKHFSFWLKDKALIQEVTDSFNSRAVTFVSRTEVDLKAMNIQKTPPNPKLSQ